MTMVLAPLILAHLVSQKTALLPVRAAEATLDDAPTLARLDAALRRGNAGLVDVDATAANLAAARDAGVVCSGNDRACLGKLAALADVDRLVSPVATRTLSGWHVVVVVVDAKARTAQIDGDVSDSFKEAKPLVDRALTIALHEPASPSSPRASIATSPSSSDARATTSNAGPRDLGGADVASMALAGTGGALIAGGLVATSAMEIALQKPEPFADRGTKLFAGQAGVVAIVVGAVAAGGGLSIEAVRAYWAPPSPSPSPSPPPMTTAVH